MASRYQLKLWMAGYMDFLEEFLWSILLNFFPDVNFLLQEGNAPIHNARVSQALFFFSPRHWLLLGISRSFESSYDIRNGFPRYC